MDATEGDIAVAVPDLKAVAAEPGATLDQTREANACKAEGNAMFKAGQYRDAIVHYGRAMALCPLDASFVANRAAAYLMLDDHEAALKDSMAAIALDPVFTKAYVRAMKCHVALGKLDQAEGLARDLDARVAASFDVQNEVVRARRLRRALELSTAAVAAGKAASELPRIQNLYKEMPSAAAVHVLLIEALLARSKYDDAIAMCSTFLRQHPTNMQLQLQRARAFYRLGRFDQAMSRLQESLRHDPDNKQCVALFKTIKRLIKAKELGNLAFKSNRLQDAYERYTEALAIDPDAANFNAVLHCNRAAVAIKLRRFAEAIADCNICLKVDSENVKALCRRATAYLETEQYEDAVRDLENAKRISGGDRDIADQLRQAQIELAKSKRKDHYKTLGVTKDCNETDVKKAYRRLALQYHPDKNHGCSEEEKVAAEAKFKDICEANEVLSDPQKRRRYDSGADLDLGGGGHPHHHGQHMDMNDVFQMFFQQGGGGGGGGGGFGHFGPGASHHYSC